MKPKLISIGYGRHIFESENVERKRLEACAAELQTFNMIVFTLKRHGLKYTKVNDSLNLYPTNSSNRFFMVFDAWLLARKLVRENKDIIVTTQDPFETALVGFLLKLTYKTPLVIQEHGDFFGNKCWRQESLLNQLRYYSGIFFMKRADLVRAVSRRGQAHLAKHGITRTNVFPVAIDPATFIFATPNLTVRSMFNSETFVFLSVCRFVPQKNLPLLIDSFSTAFKTNPNIGLLLVGKGEEEGRLKKYIETKPSAVQNAIKIIPWSSDVPGLMKAANAYVLSSNYEGWGRVLIEAMLSQLPIVTTAVGCADEVVKSGQHGLVVPVGDTALLANALIKISTDKEFYDSVKNNLSEAKQSPISGTNINDYGKEWVKTLTTI